MDGRMNKRMNDRGRGFSSLCRNTHVLCVGNSIAMLLCVPRTCTVYVRTSSSTPYSVDGGRRWYLLVWIQLGREEIIIGQMLPSAAKPRSPILRISLRLFTSHFAILYNNSLSTKYGYILRISLICHHQTDSLLRGHLTSQPYQVFEACDTALNSWHVAFTARSIPET
jgi:hypothetical protein